MFVQDPCSCSEVHIGKAGHWYRQEHQKHQTGWSAISSNWTLHLEKYSTDFDAADITANTHNYHPHISSTAIEIYMYVHHHSIKQSLTPSVPLHTLDSPLLLKNSWMPPVKVTHRHYVQQDSFTLKMPSNVCWHARKSCSSMQPNL